MRKILIVMMMVASITLGGCAAQVTPFGNVTDIQEVDLSSNFKTGESCAWVLLTFIGPFGDLSVVKAAQAGGIRKAEIIDYAITNYLIAQRTCAKVYGR